MKKILLSAIATVAIIIIACVIFAYSSGPKLSTATNSVMTVNGQDVPEGVFNYYINSTKAYLSGYGVDFTTDTGSQYMYYIESQSVDMLKEIAAVRGEAIKKGLKIDQAEVDKLLKQEKASFASDDAYKKWLTQNEMTGNDVLWLIESQVLGEAYYNNVTKAIKVSDADAKAAFDADPDKYITKQFAHIFLAVDAKATAAEKAAIKKKAEAIIQQLNNGGDFAAIATQTNTDSTANTGGSLSQSVTRDSSTYVDEFNQAAFALTKVGEYTQTPVETSFGYHIIKLEAMTDKFADLKDTIATDLSKSQKDDVYSQALDKLMKNVKIQKAYKTKYTAPADATTNGSSSSNKTTDNTTTDDTAK